jgi:hypothetical protein
MAIPRAPNRWLIPLTLLVAAAAVAACFLGYHLSWIWRRHELLDSRTVITMPAAMTKSAPRLLQLFQEPGYDTLVYLPEGQPVPFYLLLADKPARRLNAAELDQVQLAFPEARLRPYGE